jgi:hypothetical protein
MIPAECTENRRSGVDADLFPVRIEISLERGYHLSRYRGHCPQWVSFLPKLMEMAYIHCAYCQNLLLGRNYEDLTPQKTSYSGQRTMYQRMTPRRDQSRRQPQSPRTRNAYRNTRYMRLATRNQKVRRTILQMMIQFLETYRGTYGG